MKTLFVVISVVFVALFSSCKKEQTVANRFVVVGNYSFEMLSSPDENGDFEVRILNLTDSLFSYYQDFKNDEKARARCTDFSLSGMKNSVDYTSEKIIRMNQASSLSVYPRHLEKINVVALISDGYIRIPEKGEVKIFESASNLFGIN
jgi:hypothetical protein